MQYRFDVRVVAAVCLHTVELLAKVVDRLEKALFQAEFGLPVELL
jgi:hypothetical protein